MKRITTLTLVLFASVNTACSSAPPQTDAAATSQEGVAEPLGSVQQALAGWSSTGPMASARVWHTATLLNSGKVLVVGGQMSGSPPSAELYDPGNGSWSSALAPEDSLSERNGHTATLLKSGKVLVTGGCWINDVEVYDPETNHWSPARSMSEPRCGHTATLLLSGKVLVAGGMADSESFMDSAELYDPVMDSWSPVSYLKHNPETHTWIPVGYLNVARSGHTATLLDSGKVLVAGGWSYWDALGSAEVFDPSTETWSKVGDMTGVRGLHKATLLDSGKVLVPGGLNGSPSWDPIDTAELYDPAMGTWSLTGSMASARAEYTASVLPSGNVLIAGGYSPPGNHPQNTAELYEPSTGTWASTSTMVESRHGHTAVVLPSGQVLVAGGEGWGTGALSSAELYTP